MILKGLEQRDGATQPSYFRSNADKSACECLIADAIEKEGVSTYSLKLKGRVSSTNMSRFGLWTFQTLVRANFQAQPYLLQAKFAAKWCRKDQALWREPVVRSHLSSICF